VLSFLDYFSYILGHQFCYSTNSFSLLENIFFFACNAQMLEILSRVWTSCNNWGGNTEAKLIRLGKSMRFTYKSNFWIPEGSLTLFSTVLAIRYVSWAIRFLNTTKKEQNLIGYHKIHLNISCGAVYWGLGLACGFDGCTQPTQPLAARLHSLQPILWTCGPVDLWQLPRNLLVRSSWWTDGKETTCQARAFTALDNKTR
jgi:hypothetical protein